MEALPSGVSVGTGVVSFADGATVFAATAMSLASGAVPGFCWGEVVTCAMTADERPRIAADTIVLIRMSFLSRRKTPGHQRPGVSLIQRGVDPPPVLVEPVPVDVPTPTPAPTPVDEPGVVEPMLPEPPSVPPVVPEPPMVPEPPIVPVPPGVVVVPPYVPVPPAEPVVPVVPAVGSLIVPPASAPVVVEPPVPGVLTPDVVDALPRARVEDRERPVVERVVDCGVLDWDVVVWVELVDGVVVLPVPIV